jgi:hypothetical protein
MANTASKSFFVRASGRFSAKYQCIDCGEAFHTIEALYEHQFINPMCYTSNDADKYRMLEDEDTYEYPAEKYR